MVLDFQSLTGVLHKLPILGAETDGQIPTIYTRLVKQGSAKAEITLKVLSIPHDPADKFIENYIFINREHNAIDFQKILELRVRIFYLE